MFRKLICICLLLFVGSFAVYSQASKRKINGDKLITDLTKSKRLSAVFGDDGVMLFTYYPEIKRITRLGKRAIPLLIAHLDDRRVMPYLSFNVSRYKEKVRVSDVCFDLLIKIIVHNSALFDMKCEAEEYHDTAGDCLKEKYDGPGRKQRWLRAYRNGKVVYEPENIMIPN